MKHFLVSLFFTCLFLEKIAAQQHYISCNLRHSLDHFDGPNGGIKFGIGAFRLSAQFAKKHRENTWAGLQIGGGISGYWQNRPTRGTRETTFTADVFYRKDWPVAEGFRFFGHVLLGLEHTNTEVFSPSASVDAFPSDAARISLGIGAEYFFLKNWALTGWFGGGGLSFTRSKTAAHDLPPVSKKLELGIGLSSWSGALGVRYFW